MYYFLRQNLFASLGMIEIVGHTAATGARDWISGSPFLEPLPSTTLTLDATHGNAFPAFFDTSIPVMADALIAALRAAGVENLVAYPVDLLRNDTGETFRGYAAVNVVGCSDAVDYAASEYTKDETFGDVEFTGSIHIDPEKTAGFSAFRLPVGPGFLVVAESVCRHLETMPFAALLLQPTTDYEGV